MAATNLVRLNVYQIDNRVMDRDAPIAIDFPTQGCTVRDCVSSPTRSLPSGYNVYALLQMPLGGAADVHGTFYYVAETAAQVLTLFNA